MGEVFIHKHSWGASFCFLTLLLLWKYPEPWGTLFLSFPYIRPLKKAWQHSPYLVYMQLERKSNLLICLWILSMWLLQGFTNAVKRPVRIRDLLLWQGLQFLTFYDPFCIGRIWFFGKYFYLDHNTFSFFFFSDSERMYLFTRDVTIIFGFVISRFEHTRHAAYWCYNLLPTVVRRDGQMRQLYVMPLLFKRVGMWQLVTCSSSRRTATN